MLLDEVRNFYQYAFRLLPYGKVPSAFDKDKAGVLQSPGKVVRVVRVTETVFGTIDQQHRE